MGSIKGFGDKIKLNIDDKENNIIENKMVLYHGGSIEVKEPNYQFKVDMENKDPLNKRWTDFGKGFYLGDDREITEKWASLLYGKRAVINSYELDMRELTCLELDLENIESYIACLLKNGGMRWGNIEWAEYMVDSYLPVNIESYDIIIGPRLDSVYFTIIKDLIRGKIGLDIFKEALKIGNLGTQIYLQSEKSYSKIKFKSSYSNLSQDILDKAREEGKKNREGYAKLH